MRLTHDERLPNELRNLGQAFTRIALDRGADSVVEARTVDSPAELLLDDAKEIAGNGAGGELADEALTVASLSLCRQAVDAAITAAYGRLRALHGTTELPPALDGMTTARRLDKLNAALLAHERAGVSLDEALLRRLNKGAHFDPSVQPSKARRIAWVDESRAAVAAIVATATPVP